MSTSSLSVMAEEVTFENIETLLQQDEGLVEFFNSFLALPCFAERLFYNSDINLFEEFLERMADDENKGDVKAATHLRNGTLYNRTDNQSRIGYYVTVLDKVQGLEFIKKYRLPLFARSELYAEYKLCKHLSAVQGSFSRGLFCDASDDEDSGVEEAYVRRDVERVRRRINVGFNLSPSLGGTGSTDDESEFDDEFYLSPHFRSVEETLDAWHESFTRPGSRLTPLPSREEDDVWDSRSSSSCFSAQESGTNGTNSVRPVSRLSFVSDSSDRGFTAAVGSRLSSASSTEHTRDIGSRDAFRHDNTVISSEQHHEDTVRVTTSALSFAVEHIEVKNASSPPVKSDDDAIAERRDQFLTREVESVAELDRDAIERRPLGNELIEALEGAESAWGADDELMHYLPNLNKDGGENNLISKECRPKVPHITETTFVDDNETLNGKSSLIYITVQSPAVNQNDEDFTATEYEIMSHNQRVEEVSEKLSKVTEEFCSLKDGKSLSERVEEEFVPSEKTIIEDQMKKEEKMWCCSWNEKNMADCSHFQSRKTYQEGNILECSEGSSENVPIANHLMERQKSRETSRQVESVSEKDECNTIDTAFENWDVREVAEDFAPVKLTSDASGEVTSGKKGDEHCATSSADRKVEDRGGDDEGGYTTEASANSLQGIRGIFSGRRRESTVATSVALDIDEESAYSDDASEVEKKPYDLSTKSAFDAFKTFVLGTSAEKLLQFWLEVECGRNLASDLDKARLVQSLRDRFLKSGGIYEFSPGTKSGLDIKDASKLTYDSLFNIQPHILKPLLNYWCIRFTMHQQRSSHSEDLDYKRLVSERPKSCVRRENMLSNLPQVPAHTGLAQVFPKAPLTRPQTSGMSKKTTQHQTSRPQIRAKSAHPRLIQAPELMHTNASSKQLQNIMAPVRMGYGFDQVPGPSFPVEPEPDYLCSVRLFINPAPSPDSKMQRILRTLHRTSVAPGTSKPGCIKETEPETDITLDSLIQGLIYERQTGNYFEQFLQDSGNETWTNCLAFWKSLQEYNAYFYADSLKPSVLSRKAQTMFANFIAPGSCHDIHVSRDIQTQVHRELEPPYEELFDAVEEHVLYSLLEPWNMLLKQEKQVFSCEVSKEQTLRHLEIKAMTRRRQSVANTHGGLDSVDDDQEKERISVEEANRPLSVPKDGFTFEALIKNREEVEHFKEFLGKKHAKGIKDLMAWTDMETFRRVPGSMEDKRDKKAREIRDSWLGKKYFFGQDSPATREGRKLIMNLNGGRAIKDRPSSPVIFESQKFVRARIERRWLMLFKQTTEFLERQKSHAVGIPEMVEDIMLKRRLQRSEAAWKILNSRWVSSSRDVVALRQTLLNPDSCAEFSAFVAIKGDTLESNVQFWLEVQKFKDLCHAHAQPALIHRKIQTIIDCFLNSAISPELQIDIPIEMADKLMERLSSRNTLVHPYVFREAQMTVFRVLFNHWKEFLTYRSKIPEGEYPQEHFQDQLRRHRADMKSKKEASERRRLARLSAERKKKEKEEREKRRIEDLASLFSMEPASIFYSEEDDLRSWFYSKHLVELERQEHIKRLREQGITLPEEDFIEEKEDAKSRRSRLSLTKSSTFTKVGDNRKVRDGGSENRSSEGSSRKLQAKLQTKLSPPSIRRGSGVSTGQSTTYRNSGMSQPLTGKETNKDGSNAIKQGEQKDVSSKDIVVDKKSGRKTSEIQVIPIAPSEIQEPIETDRWQNKLLPQRTRSSKRLLTTKQQPTSAGKKRVPLDAISCVSDYSVFSNIELVPRTVSLRKHGRQDDVSLLTSKSLRDFTNSPEGAQLSMPLPLVRISSASHVDKSDTDGSIGDPSPLCFKPRPLRQSLRKATTWSAKAKGLDREQMKLQPDVIVN